MGAIAGVIGKSGQDVSEQTSQMLQTIKHRTLCAAISIGKDKILHRSFPDCSEKISIICDGAIYNNEALKEKLAHHHFRTDSDAETIAHLVEECGSKLLTEAVKATLSKLHGVYAFAVLRRDEIVVARDPVGVKPLYLGEDAEFVAFASERKALWRIGIMDVEPLPPGHIARLTRRGYLISKAVSLEKPQIRKIDMKNAALKLKDALHDAFEVRLRNIKEVGLAFSGGLDSSIAAKIVSDLGKRAVLYTVGLEGSWDIEIAEDASSELDCDLRIRILSVSDVEAYLPRVIYAIEESDVMKVGVGLPLYVAAEMAHSDGVDAMLTGQGADELFAGYARYQRILRSGGYARLQESLWNDLRTIYKVNLQRDDAVAMASGVELLTPYLDAKVIEVAMSIPPHLKLSGRGDVLGKRVLRKVAEMIDLSYSIFNRPKKAVQYSSGTERAIRKLSERADKCSNDFLEMIFRRVFDSKY